MSWVNKYIGIPFVDSGRTIDGCDCWGLVRLVLLEEAGIAVESYGECSTKDLHKIAKLFDKDSKMEPWRTIDIGSERKFDLVLMKGLSSHDRPRAVDLHVGIVTQPGWLLHIEDTTDSVHMCFRAGVVGGRPHPAIARRVAGVYRHGGSV